MKKVLFIPLYKYKFYFYRAYQHSILIHFNIAFNFKNVKSVEFKNYYYNDLIIDILFVIKKL